LTIAGDDPIETSELTGRLSRPSHLLFIPPEENSLSPVYRSGAAMEMQVTARNLALTVAIDSAIRQEAEKLERFYPRITGCRVLVEAENRFASGEAVFYSVRIDLDVP
jgi:hypothetical protein